MANDRRTGNGGGGSTNPPSNSNSSGSGSGFRGRRVTTCSFCGKSSRDVGPMVEGPSDVYICANCVDLAHNIIRQEKRKLTSAQPLFNSIPSPRQIKEFLDQYVVGQDGAKRSALDMLAYSTVSWDMLARVSLPLSLQHCILCNMCACDCFVRA